MRVIRSDDNYKEKIRKRFIRIFRRSEEIDRRMTWLVGMYVTSLGVLVAITAIHVGVMTFSDDNSTRSSKTYTIDNVLEDRLEGMLDERLGKFDDYTFPHYESFVVSPSTIRDVENLPSNLP